MKILPFLQWFRLWHQSGVAAYKDKKYDQSFKLFTKASENNCANADFYLAAQYYNGQHISKNLGVAKEKFKQACHKGLKTACIMEWFEFSPLFE